MKKHWFKFTLLALTLVLAVVVWGLLDTLWTNMEAFEAASEIGAITEYFDNFAQGDYETAVKTSGFVFDEKNTQEDYIRYLRETYGSDFSDLRFAGSDGEVPGQKAYRIYNGDTRLGSVTLIPVEGQKRNWKVISDVELSPELTVTAPSFVTVLANGLPQTPNEESAVNHPDFADLTEHITVPQTVTYTVGGYLYTPVITGAVEGYPCVVTEKENNREITVSVPEEKKAEIEGYMTDFSQLYARYVTEDASFAALKPKMLQGTEFYEKVRTFYSGWYTTHTGYEFRNLQITDVVMADENHFSGTIQFDHVIFRGKKEDVFPSHYRLSFTCKDGQWLLADLKIV